MEGDEYDMVTVSAVRPWNSRYAEQPKERRDVEPVTYDTTEEIDECTACPLSVCINCHDKRKQREQPHRVDIILMLQRGASAEECAARYGVSLRAVRNYQKLLGRGNGNG